MGTMVLMSGVFQWLFSQYEGVPTEQVWAEAIAVVFGLLSVWFAKKGNIWVYPTGLINTITFVWLLWVNTLWGDMLINAYYTVMSIYGWVLWSSNANHNVVEVAWATRTEWRIASVLGVASAVFVAVVYYLKPFIKNGFSMEGVQLGAHNFRWTECVDILTTALFLVGMWLMAKRKVENWVLWIIADLISVPLYYVKGMKFTSLQYALFTAIAVMGYISWKKSVVSSQGSEHNG